MDKRIKEEFYQSKYSYYRNMSIWIVVLSVVASNTYWISDCQIFGRLAWETILPRMFMLFPLVGYLILAKYVKNYKVMILASYLMIHGIMWCTIWAIYYLPIKTHANEGFIIMQLMFMGMGLCSPRVTSTILHCFLLVDIIASYPINHYENIDLMMTLGIPALVAVEALIWIMESGYKDQFHMKKELELSYKTDLLTKAYNRNVITEICSVKPNEFPFECAGMLLIDIDFFKRVNDLYGHDIGDQVLRYLTKILKMTVRDKDYVIRWGGEEFLVILPDCNVLESMEIAERLRTTVEDKPFNTSPVTISIGVSVYEKGDYHNTVKQADKALYYAKDHGRNQVICFNDILENA